MQKDNSCVGLKMSDAYDYLAYLEMTPTFIFFSSKKKEEKGSKIY